MDFAQGLPMRWNRHNTILVVVDRSIKVSHFILGNLSAGAPKIGHKFIKEFFRLNGVLEKIILDRNARIHSRFWKTLFTTLGAKLNISLPYHLKKNG